MPPQALEEWTLDAIRDLVRQGIFESRSFDFKETLPAAGDERGKTRFRKTLAAFANSPGGGFLLIGVKDDRTLDVDARIVGVDPGVDVPEHLGAQASACTPRVEWQPQNPPHRLPSGRVLHVVQVKEGATKPHGLFDGERWIFPKRTDRGNELLSYEEVRDGFRDQQRVRATLAAIKAEADRMAEHAMRLQLARNKREDDTVLLALLFRPALLEAALFQVLGLLEGETALLRHLDLLRGAAAAADVQASRLLLEGGNMDPFLKLVPVIGDCAREVASAIDRKLRLPAP